MTPMPMPKRAFKLEILILLVALACAGAPGAIADQPGNADGRSDARAASGAQREASKSSSGPTAHAAAESTVRSPETPASLSTPVSTPDELVQHGWVAVRDHAQQVTHLIHLPPRGVGPGRVDPGTIRMVAATPDPVERVAVWGMSAGSNAAMILADSIGGGGGVMNAPLPPTKAEKPASGRGAVLSRVLGIAATPLGDNGWNYPPGRPQVLASLPGTQDVLGAAGSALGPVVLLREIPRYRESPTASGWSVRVLTQNQWRPVRLPWQSDSEASAWDDEAYAGLVSWSDALGVLVFKPGATLGELWIAKLEPALRSTPSSTPRANAAQSAAPARGPSDEPAQSVAAREPSPMNAVWERVEVPLPPSFLIDAGGASGAGAPSGRVVQSPDVLVGVDEVGGGLGAGGEQRHLLALTWDPAGGRALSVMSLRAQAARPLCVLSGVARDAGVTSVHRDAMSSGLAMVWIEQGPVARNASSASSSDDSGPTPIVPTVGKPAGPRPLSGPGAIAPSESRLMIREIGLNGNVIFDGAARTGERRFGKEAEFLAMLLLMVMVGVVLFVVKPDAPVKIGLPDDMELASPTRRFIGAAIDYLLAAVLSGWILGVPLREAFLPLPMIAEDYDPRLLLLSLGIAWVHTTVSEAVMGRSIGKMITGTWLMKVEPMSKVAPSPATGDVQTSRKPDSVGPDELPASPAEQGIAMGKPSFWSCAVRNLVRWTMPVLGVFVFFDPFGRHPGDLGGRTIVVQFKPELESTGE